MAKRRKTGLYFNRVEYRTYRVANPVVGGGNFKVDSDAIPVGFFWYVLYAAVHVLLQSSAQDVAFFLVPERDRGIPAVLGTGIFLPEQKTGVLFPTPLGQASGVANPAPGRTFGETPLSQRRPFVISPGYFLRVATLNNNNVPAQGTEMELRLAVIQLALCERVPL